MPKSLFFSPTFRHVSISSFIPLANDRLIDGQIDKFHIGVTFRCAGTSRTRGVPVPPPTRESTLEIVTL